MEGVTRSAEDPLGAVPAVHARGSATLADAALCQVARLSSERIRVRFPGARGSGYERRLWRPGTEAGLMGRTELFRIHTRNLRAIQKALDHAGSAARDAIRNGHAEVEQSLTLACALLLGSAIETRLNRVITEPGGFSDDELETIRGQRSQARRWLAAIDTGFRRRHDRWHLTEDSLGPEAWLRLQTIRPAFESTLEPIISMRNTLAHGQWSVALNSREVSENAPMTALIHAETVQTISIKNRLGHHYEQLILDLVSTKHAFERDFEVTYSKFQQTLEALARADESVYRSELQARAARGATRRAYAE